MKEIKKESLKIFSKNNFKSLILVILIKTLINLILIFLTFLTFYSLTDCTIPESNFLYQFLYPINLIKNLNTVPLSYLLIFTLFYSFIMFIPLQMGIYLWFSKIKKDNNLSLAIIFNYYKSLKLVAKSISFVLIMLFKSFSTFLLFFVPTISTFLFACFSINSFPQEYQIFLRILILISAISVFISILFFFRSQVFQIFTKFIFVLDDSENIFTTIKSSYFLIHNNKKYFKKFFLSFCGYTILCLFIITIPFVFSYFQVCMLELAKKIIYKQNQGISSIPLTQKVIDINI